MNSNPNYTVLEEELTEAYNQAAYGKGRNRHVMRDEPFDQQLIFIIERAGLSFCQGQAVKKIFEASKTGNLEDYDGAIVYTAVAKHVAKESINEKIPGISSVQAERQHYIQCSVHDSASQGATF